MATRTIAHLDVPRKHQWQLTLHDQIGNAARECGIVQLILSHIEYGPYVARLVATVTLAATPARCANSYYAAIETTRRQYSTFPVGAESEVP
jgi:hypothetical protein